MTDDGHLVAGRYRLLRPVGTGAMGVVWQGHDERLKRPVAVKKLMLQPGLPPPDAAEAVARCLREGRIAARLHHPNAITVFDVVDEDGVPCLVMEYMRSRTLAMIMAEAGPLPAEQVADIGAQVAAALAAAHAAGIVHRDIKPDNILLGEDGSVKITDFGISRASDDVTVTKTGLIAGTPAYLAPEVALGADPTPASDVFSLGSTLYAAVEGESPFGLSANTLELLHKVGLGVINPPQRSGPLTEVLSALLAADPQARPTTAKARDLLAAVGRGESWAHAPVVAAPATSSTPGDAVDEGDALVADATELVRPPAARVSSESTSVDRSRTSRLVAAVFVVALVTVAAWLLGGRNSFAPTEERVPANGTVHSPTTPSSGSAPVAPVAPVTVAEKAGTDETPTTKARNSRTATMTPAESLKPTTTSRTTPRPTTTTTQPSESTTTTTTTPPPSSSEETPTPSKPLTAAGE